MSDSIVIRDERPSDAAGITSVTVEAFKTLEVSHQTEHYIVNALRRAGALAVSLVAQRDGRVVGHIAFSAVTISDGSGGWYGLGPVSVVPQFQRQGIGTALIEAGLSRLRAMGARGCCLVGHPQYYKRFGFENAAQLGVAGVPAEVFHAISFDGQWPKGTVEFHQAFTARE